MARISAVVLLLFSCAALVAADLGSRKLLQSTDPNGGTIVTVSQDKPRVDAIAITPALPYPQTGIYCNVTGDSRIPAAGAFFPLTVRVPVGVEATVVFANVTGVIPGSNSSCSSVVQQPGTSVVQQPGTSVVQQPNTTTVVQQPGAPGVIQPGTTSNCTTTVLQQPTSVVQQNTSTPTTVTQPTPPTTVTQPTPPTTVTQPTPPTTVKQPSPPTTVTQPAPDKNPPATVKQPSPPTTVTQPGIPPVPPVPTTVTQPGIPPVPPVPTTVQQPPATVQQNGRRLLQTAAPIEFISNNGSMGQPQLSVQDTTEGVPSISFKPTSQSQTASFNGALQVAVTTTNDGFGTPYIPYRVDSRISPNCGVVVKFVAI